MQPVDRNHSTTDKGLKYAYDKEGMAQACIKYKHVNQISWKTRLHIYIYIWVVIRNTEVEILRKREFLKVAISGKTSVYF
uniref:Transposase n=1 Tax=Heterorhabditis bacteriophora TaxID=37862 RepID=A0A1I7WRT4_HETBA